MFKELVMQIENILKRKVDKQKETILGKRNRLYEVLTLDIL